MYKIKVTEVRLFLFVWNLCCKGICLFQVFLRNVRTKKVSNPFQTSKYLHHALQAWTGLEL